MGVRKKYLEKRVSINFKTNEKKRNEFMRIVNYKLLTKGNFVMNKMVDDFLSEWNSEEGKQKIYKKYFKLNI